MARELDETRVGIICLTPENLNAPWILFEAGALSKKRFAEASYVCTYLFDVVPADVEEPLAQFQHTIANKEDTKRLLQTINKTINNQVLDADALSEEHLNRAFEKWWPELEEALASVPSVEGEPKTRRSDSEMLEEIVLSVRAIERQVVEGRKRQEKAIATTTATTIPSWVMDMEGWGVFRIISDMLDKGLDEETVFKVLVGRGVGTDLVARAISQHKRLKDSGQKSFAEVAD